MTRPGATTYSLDAHDRIISVGGQWAAFAAANDGPSATDVVGTPLWDSFTGTSIIELWRHLVARARGGADVDVRIRCDSSDLRRVVALTVRGAAGGGIDFTAVVEEESARPPIPLFDADAPRSSELLRTCAWCHALGTPAGWVTLEDGVRELGLLDGRPLPLLTHGICDRCFAEASTA
jgi:hypothetical protein